MAIVTPDVLSNEPVLVADDPILDMLNTRASINGILVDFWHHDADVARWLERAGWFDAEEVPIFTGGTLLTAALELREIIRVGIEQRKTGVQSNLTALNAYLRKALSHPQLIWVAPDTLRLERVREQQTAEQFLAPLAEAGAQLLVDGDFALIRTCEHADCVLWFYDRTKSHKRRWCSMAQCGNRHKVAEFRKRKLHV
ncbi:CGNR zinc finger domain-containing protein [Pseudomonas sp. 10B1]|uniref:CGNR zinc finger domain-containing protein n=1 Tax=unclassified Pseudomonas TaxID=196821 RepID=UPI002AB43580|nr:MULTISPECIES: ABATE domain-containing protein [unclassified Pseudomonas]MDY7560251.1 CGNR zinc finger domain-containing protein [Pseudomonas sp. AB6]MEA9975634.1 CGNR zinc finger domain-containing protein [Pseudomonas sp. RTS4]MEA9993881.1 CGNR zinc finger domain-containing protein [Pseudomonas sp. AA4]MEB0085439.1 CGNR zinc finger domain-containing protein [Pseudomonas sp. RTI1]MEB0124501.1 CGNR zinc finger domain-containing protein [Pseudomonas sp. CCC1.2]